MMSPMSFGAIPARRTTSGRIVVIRISGGVFASAPLNDRPIAVLAALTMTGVGMSSASGSRAALAGAAWRTGVGAIVAPTVRVTVLPAPGAFVTCWPRRTYSRRSDDNQGRIDPPISASFAHIRFADDGSSHGSRLGDAALDEIVDQ